MAKKKKFQKERFLLCSPSFAKLSIFPFSLGKGERKSKKTSTSSSHSTSLLTDEKGPEGMFDLWTATFFSHYSTNTLFPFLLSEFTSKVFCFLAITLSLIKLNHPFLVSKCSSHQGKSKGIKNDSNSICGISDICPLSYPFLGIFPFLLSHFAVLSPFLSSFNRVSMGKCGPRISIQAYSQFFVVIFANYLHFTKNSNISSAKIKIFYFPPSSRKMGVQMSNSNHSVIKEGFVQRFKSGFLSSKWKSNYAVLYPDSTLAIYSERGDSRPAENILLRNVVPYICVGFMTDRMPVRRPSLPPGTAVQRLVGIGMDPQASKVHWILFPSEQVLEEWFNAIMTTLPKPPPQPNPTPNAQGPEGPVPNAAGGFVPPAKYPDAPPPYGMPPPNQPVGGYAAYPPGQQPPYGAAAPQYPPPGQQTVIIDRRPASGYGGGGGGGGSSGFGTGLAAGMGGALLGSLVGYGIGSMFAPHGGWGGYGGGWGGGYGGMGSGFGGGYIQDNDTYVTNNYFINNDDTNSTPAHNADQGDYTEPVQNDYSNDNYDDGGGGTWGDDGGGWGGDDGGGGFDGGFDGGGGDW